MASTSRIVELAGLIQKHTSAFDQYLTSHNIPSPSFDETCPPILQLPAEIEAAQMAAIEATEELLTLLQGPVASVFGEYIRVGD